MAEGKLKEVERDATRIQTKRFNDHFEEQAYKAEDAKAKEAPVKESDDSDKKGK